LMMGQNRSNINILIYGGGRPPIVSKLAFARLRRTSPKSPVFPAISRKFIRRPSS
jgi:hypothetical protein